MIERLREVNREIARIDGKGSRGKSELHQGKGLGNAQGKRFHGKCHRKQTAEKN